MKNTGLLIVVLAMGVLAGCSNTSSDSGSDTSYSPEVISEFAQCLTDQGAVFYGTEWCPHCKNQKALFGDAIKYIKFVDCDINKLQCQIASIAGYPTRIFADGSRVSGTQRLESLAQKTSCELPVVE